MDSIQNRTDNLNITNTPEPDVRIELLNIKQQTFIDYKAVGGWLTAPDANIPKKMTMQELADKLEIGRQTLYDWTKSIPSFWERVAARRKELFSQERLIKIQDTWYLKALAGSYPHLQLWLANYDPNFRMPTEKLQHELGNSWSSLIALKQAKENIQEAEVIDADPTSNA